MRVQDVMTKGVKTIAPTAAAEDAWNVMRLNRIHHLVVTKANRVVGVLSDRADGGVDFVTRPATTSRPVRRGTVSLHPGRCRCSGTRITSPARRTKWRLNRRTKWRLNPR